MTSSTTAPVSEKAVITVFTVASDASKTALFGQEGMIWAREGIETSMPAEQLLEIQCGDQTAACPWLRTSPEEGSRILGKQKQQDAKELSETFDRYLSELQTGGSPLLIYFVGAGGAGAGVMFQIFIRYFQASPSRTIIDAQNPLSSIGPHGGAARIVDTTAESQSRLGWEG